MKPIRSYQYKTNSKRWNQSTLEPEILLGRTSEHGKLWTSVSIIPPRPAIGLCDRGSPPNAYIHLQSSLHSTKATRERSEQFVGLKPLTLPFGLENRVQLLMLWKKKNEENVNCFSSQDPVFLSSQRACVCKGQNGWSQKSVGSHPVSINTQQKTLYMLIYIFQRNNFIFYFPPTSSKMPNIVMSQN